MNNWLASIEIINAHVASNCWHELLIRCPYMITFADIDDVDADVCSFDC